MIFENLLNLCHAKSVEYKFKQELYINDSSLVGKDRISMHNTKSVVFFFNVYLNILEQWLCELSMIDY